MTRLMIAVVAFTACARSAQPVLRPSNRPTTAGAPTLNVSRLEVPDGARAVATNGSAVVALTFEHELIGLTKYGVTVFRTRLDIPSTVSVGLVLVGDVAVLAGSGSVHAVDVTNGKTRWGRVAEGSDMFSTSIHDGLVEISSEVATMTLDAQTGQSVAPRLPTSPVRKIETKRLGAADASIGSEKVRLVATERNRELWQLDAIVPFSTQRAHVMFDATTLIVRLVGATSTLVALDSLTGASRWSVALGPGDTLIDAAAAPGFFWVIIGDGEALADGRGEYRVIAVREGGNIFHQLRLPEPAARYCGGVQDWASANGVLVVRHTASAKGRCGVSVVDVYSP